MRMWGVDPTRMCRKHLLGEHVELHMLVGTIRRGGSIQGYIDLGLIEPRLLWERHDALVAEMHRRGYRHDSPLPRLDLPSSLLAAGHIDLLFSYEDLITRCPDCRALYHPPT